ncbi:MAG: aldo/keto reductase [Rhodocyclaceae bacterium]|nr:aldo/keto reductase [Rhodocyclaceae bacterium]
MNDRKISASRRRSLGILVAAALGGTVRLPQAADPVRRPLASRPIPSTGEPLPVIGLGTYRSFDIGDSEAESAPLREVLRRFVAGGGRLIDSSPMYGRSEATIGRLAGELGVGDRLFHATKVWTRGRDDGIDQMARSFARMGVERMDLMEVHNLLDVDTHLETLRAWRREGRIRYLGVTHYHAGAYGELASVLERGNIDFVQLNFSIGEPEAERHLLPLARDRGIAVIVNRPFAKGALFRWVRGRAVPPWAADYGAASWAQLFLKFILGHPAVTCAIPATGNPEHLLDNLAAGAGPLPDQAGRRLISTRLADL